MRALQRGVLAKSIKKLHGQYGEVVRIAPGELSFISAAAIRDIQSSGPGRLGFPRCKTFFETASTEGIFTSNDADHSRIRKSLWRVFSPHALKSREELLQSYVNLFIERLKDTIQGGECIGTATGSPSFANIDIVKWFDFIAFDMVGDMTFGEPFGCLQKTMYHPFVSLICSHVKALGFLFSIRFYPVLFKLLLRFLPQSLLEESNRYDDYVKLNVRRRLNDASKCNDQDIISLLKGGEEDNEARMGEITAILSTLILAGSETTATVLSGTVNHLCKNPDILRRLVNEVRSFPTESDLTPVALSQLPFLSAVLKEGIRMCHPVCVGLTRTVPPQGGKIDNHWVPGNVSERTR